MKKIILLTCILFLISCEDKKIYEPEYTLPETVVVELEDQNMSEETNDTKEIEVIDQVVEEDNTELVDLSEKEILWLQESLKIAGFYTSLDGSYGPSSKKQLDAFKLQEGIQSDGYTIEVKNILENYRRERLADNFATDLVVLSKNHYIPSSYEPDYLREVNVQKNKYMELPDYVALKVEEMFEAAKQDGYTIALASAYRSYDYQEGIFSRRVEKNGFAEAETVVAIPGQSEHQTGLAIDITTANMNYGLDQSFEDEAEFDWMMENCYKFGFILSYRKDKVDITGYIYEPWHYRYIGDVDMAKEIMDAEITLQEYFE